MYSPDYVKTMMPILKQNPKALLELSNNNDLVKEVMSEYTEALINKNVAITRRQLKELDIIDFRNIASPPENKTEMPTFDKSIMDEINLTRIEMDWLVNVPCFSEGVYHINTDRYLHYKLEDINITDKTMVISVQDYAQYNYQWDIGTKITASVDFQNPQGELDLKERTFSDLYNLIPYEELGWGKEKQKIFEIIKQNAKLAEKEMKQKNTSHGENLFVLFALLTVKANMLLTAHKPKAVRKSRRKIQIEESDNISNPAKIIRTVGPISIKSRKPPKATSETIVRKYKVASWKVRGGVRRLKSGKLVHFKESVHHRKCLTEKQTPPKTIIKLKR